MANIPDERNHPEIDGQGDGIRQGLRHETVKCTWQMNQGEQNIEVVGTLKISAPLNGCSSAVGYFS